MTGCGPARRQFIPAAAVLVLTTLATAAGAQQSKVSVNADCLAFAFSPDGQRIVYATRHVARVQKEIIEHDTIEQIGISNGHKRMLADGGKLFPTRPHAAPFSYHIDSLRFGPDGQKLTVELYAQAFTLRPEPGHGKKAKPTQVVVPSGKGAEMTLLLDADGKQIRIGGTGESTIDNAFNATWLADGTTVVYLAERGNGALYGLASLDTATGRTTSLLSGHGYVAVAWDAGHNAAVAIEPSEAPNGSSQLVRINLLDRTERVLAPANDYASELTVSSDGAKVGYFADGQTLVIRDVANATHSVRITVPMGRFEWAADDAHLLLKRGPDKQTDQLLWVDLAEGQFAPAVHGLIYHDFHLSPDGQSVAVTEPGSYALRLLPLH